MQNSQPPLQDINAKGQEVGSQICSESHPQCGAEMSLPVWDEAFRKMQSDLRAAIMAQLEASLNQVKAQVDQVTTRVALTEMSIGDVRKDLAEQCEQQNSLVGSVVSDMRKELYGIQIAQQHLVQKQSAKAFQELRTSLADLAEASKQAREAHRSDIMQEVSEIRKELLATGTVAEGEPSHQDLRSLLAEEKRQREEEEISLRARLDDVETRLAAQTAQGSDEERSMKTEMDRLAACIQDERQDRQRAVGEVSQLIEEVALAAASLHRDMSVKRVLEGMNEAHWARLREDLLREVQIRNSSTEARLAAMEGSLLGKFEAEADVIRDRLAWLEQAKNQTVGSTADLHQGRLNTMSSHGPARTLTRSPSPPGGWNGKSGGLADFMAVLNKTLDERHHPQPEMHVQYNMQPQMSPEMRPQAWPQVQHSPLMHQTRVMSKPRALSPASEVQVVRPVTYVQGTSSPRRSDDFQAVPQGARSPPRPRDLVEYRVGSKSGFSHAIPASCASARLPAAPS